VVTPDRRDSDGIVACMTIGITGQILSTFFTVVLLVQKSSKFKRRGATHRHRRQMCTSVCQALYEAPST
jgi:hypothetical protein